MSKDQIEKIEGITSPRRKNLWDLMTQPDQIPAVPPHLVGFALFQGTLSKCIGLVFDSLVKVQERTLTNFQINREEKIEWDRDDRIRAVRKRIPQQRYEQKIFLNRKIEKIL